MNKPIILAAMDPNRVIGNKGQLPWHIPEELAHFKATTMKHAMIMGRNTYDSIGGSLPGRISIVLTNRPIDIPGFSTHNIHTALDMARIFIPTRQVFIIGGAHVFKQYIEAGLVDRAIISHIHCEYDGDTFFPLLVDWECVSSKEYADFTVKEWVRNET